MSDDELDKAQKEQEAVQQLVYVTKYLLDKAAKTQDPRLVKLAQQSVNILKESSGVEALLFMLPDEDETPETPYQPRRRR